MAAKQKISEEFTRPPADCAHMGCGFHAEVKIKTITGWAKLCSKHYLSHFQDIADKNSERLGLKTALDHRKWMKENRMQFKSFKGVE